MRRREEVNKIALAFTGHRPNKLGGYSPTAQLKLRSFAQNFLAQHRGLISVCYSGMALGWDQAVALACMDLNIPFIAAVPFEGQESAWPAQSQKEYQRILSAATKVAEVCAPGYAAWKMQTRNEYMVDHGRLLVALWDGTTGGTANCVEYADRKGKLVKNLWAEWTRF
jgi:uncharacterized phage-like protein YoqJ